MSRKNPFSWLYCLQVFISILKDYNSYTTVNSKPILKCQQFDIPLQKLGQLNRLFCLEKLSKWFENNSIAALLFILIKICKPACDFRDECKGYMGAVRAST